MSAQLLLNPIAGDEATFSSLWLTSYDVIPAVMNVYVLVDPSMGVTSAPTAPQLPSLASTRAEQVSARWRAPPHEALRAVGLHQAVQAQMGAPPQRKMVKIGYERYGHAGRSRSHPGYDDTGEQLVPDRGTQDETKGQHAKPTASTARAGHPGAQVPLSLRGL